MVYQTTGAARSPGQVSPPAVGKGIDVVQVQVETAMSRIGELIKTLQTYCDNILGSVPTGASISELKASEGNPGRLNYLRTTVTDLESADR